MAIRWVAGRVVLTHKCPHCKEEIENGTGRGTVAGEICLGCADAGQAIERAAGLHPVNQHQSWL